MVVISRCREENKIKELFLCAYAGAIERDYLRFSWRRKTSIRDDRYVSSQTFLWDSECEIDRILSAERREVTRANEQLRKLYRKCGAEIPPI